MGILKQVDQEMHMLMEREPKDDAEWDEVCDEMRKLLKEYSGIVLTSVDFSKWIAKNQKAILAAGDRRQKEQANG